MVAVGVDSSCSLADVSNLAVEGSVEEDIC